MKYTHEYTRKSKFLLNLITYDIDVTIFFRNYAFMVLKTIKVLAGWLNSNYNIKSA